MGFILLLIGLLLGYLIGKEHGEKIGYCEGWEACDAIWRHDND